MTEQTKKLCQSMLELAKWFKDFDAEGHQWIIVSWRDTLPWRVTLDEVAPLPIISIGSTTKPNLFESRTSALRRSEESCRKINDRSEKGHWGVWEWKDNDGKVYQSVLPAAAFKKITQSYLLPEATKTGITLAQDMVELTHEIFEQGKSTNGGFSKRQLALFGIESFDKYWKKSLIGKTASVEVVKQFIALKDKHLVEKLQNKTKLPEFIPVDFDIQWPDQYKHPNWQRMRLFILERDSFRCIRCGEHHRLLHVHHLRYNKSGFVWEVDPADLQTICEKCHSLEHNRDLTV